MFRYRLPIPLCLLLTLAACSEGVTTTPTQPPMSSTPASLSTAIVATATVAVAPTAKPMPTSEPQATALTFSLPDDATRIQFAPGTTHAEVSGDLTQPAFYNYVLYAQASQTLQLQNGWDAGEAPDVQITIRDAEGVVLATGNLAEVGETALPSTQDYYISIQAEAPFLLKVTIPASEICPFSEETLRNATYTLDGFEFQLVDGEADLPQVVPGDPEENRRYARYMSVAGCGDLNGDGATDALVVLDTHTLNTTGHFRVLAALLSRDGQPDNVAMTGLGDRTIILDDGNTVQPGVVELNVITQGPNEAMSGPTQEERWHFQFADDVLMRCATQFMPYLMAEVPHWSVVSYAHLDLYLRQMGVQVCLPPSWGIPQVHDQNSLGIEHLGGTGRKISVLFDGEVMPSLVYASYDFSWPTELVYVISRDDYDAVQNGTKDYPIEHQGVSGFMELLTFDDERFGPAAMRMFVFTFPDHYILVGSDWLEFESSEALEQARAQLLAPPYPETHRVQLERHDRLLAGLSFRVYQVAPEQCAFWDTLKQSFSSVAYEMNEKQQITGLRVTLDKAVDIPAGWIVEWRQMETPPTTIRAEYGPLRVEPGSGYVFHAPPQCVIASLPGMP